MRHVKYLFSTLLLLLCCVSVSAQVEINGIRYNLKLELKTAEVTSGSYQYFSTVTIPSTVTYDNQEYQVTSIGSSVFNGCSGLTAITIPESVTSIGERTFYKCSDLTSIAIPKGVTSIENGVFYGCSSLTSITLPEGVTSIGESAFRNCGGLTSITLPEGVTSIGEGAFRGCYGLTSITLPEGLKSIGESAFSDCWDLASITIPEGVTSIGKGAFNGCGNLTSITIPESVKSIGGGAFSRCGISSIIVAEGNTSYDSRYGCNAIIETGSNTLIQGCSTTVIPEGVTSIGESAFCGCGGLTSITIPESVTSIGKEAFWYCGGITSITIPEGVTSIENGVFYGCSNLTSIVLPEGVTSIEGWTFYACSNLTSITLPKGVTSIGESAFGNCSSLTSITLPEGVTSIGESAFYKCSSLTSITLLEGMKSIGESAFFGCSGLTSIVFPKTLETISNSAFGLCTRLSNVYCYAESVPSISIDAFNSKTIKNAILRVPADVLDSYKATAPWSGFGSIIALGVYITDIELCQSSAILIEGESLPLTITLAPEDMDKNLIAWSSSNPSVAVVDNQGKVTAVAPGKATITAAAIDGGEASDSCEVTVLYADYVITYKVDGEVYATDTVTRASAVTPLAEPIKEGYTFSGWSEIPETMPGHDVTVNGTFTINKYLVTFEIDGVVITFNTQEYGTAIVPPEVSEREGYTFSGWLNLPESVPACDITINGSYTINKYLITYIVGDEVYHTDSIAYGTYITSIKNPVKEGYTFNGWGEIPEKMPTNDVTVIGTFSINKYKVTYTVDDVTHYTDSIVYGGQIKDIASPTKEGYSFGGWEKNHQTMPAYDVIINGTFIINKYQISYVVGGETIHTDSITYNERITPIESPEQEGFTFSGWIGVPGIMPAYDVTVGGEFFIKNMQTDSQGLMYVLNEETETFELSNYEGNLTGTIVIPADLYGYPVNGVKERALMGAENLIAVVIPENVSSVGYRAFYGCNNLSYIEWETTAPVDAACFDEPARHGNLLVYVKDAATEVTYQGNVIVDGVAERIAITNEQPLRNIREFTARNITFTRQFTKKTERGVAGGWEAMIIPFDVETVTSENRGELKPFGEADFTTSLPYWIAQLQTDGSFAYIDSIKANRPFIMEVPNCDEYQDIYNVEGAISFGAENVTVYATTDMNHDMGNGYTMMGNYEGTASDGYVYALNDEEYAADGDVYLPGGVFVADSRDIRPFEAYIYSNQPTASPYLRIGKKGTTDIDNLLIQRTDDAWYNLQGVRLSGKPTERGVYIINRKKVVID